MRWHLFHALEHGAKTGWIVLRRAAYYADRLAVWAERKARAQ
jgi:hypothetical protein